MNKCIGAPARRTPGGLVMSTHVSKAAIRLAFAAAAACSSLPVSGPAVAAETDAQAGTIEQITVTARRREESLQDVPVAITALTADQLLEQNVRTLEDMTAYAPNIKVNAGRATTSTINAYIRGVGQNDPLWGFEPGVGIYLDDVYIARPQGALLDVFDVQRIEVLRGPQGTLYGKNTIGGAIKYVSREMTDRRQGGLSYTGGSYGTRDIRGSISGALIEGKLRARAAGAYLSHDGYGTNLFTGREVSNKKTIAGRLGLDWLASDKVKVQLSYDRTDDDAEPKALTRLAA